MLTDRISKIINNVYSIPIIAKAHAALLRLQRNNKNELAINSDGIPNRNNKVLIYIAKMCKS